MIVDGLSIPRYEAEPLLESYLPYGHQVIARNLIRSRNEFFLFLTAPTGSGKTESWAIPALREDNLGVVLALYPTNALAEDQYRTLTELRDKIAPERRIEFITAERLGLLREEYSFRMTKGEVFEDILRSLYRDGGGVVVSNPDIFMYALKNVYSYPYLTASLRNFVSTVVFDEFHLYDLRQSDFILFLLHDLLLSQNCSMKKFMFLSATPEEGMIKKIRDVIGGDLVVAGPSCEEQIIDSRPVLPEVAIEFIPVQKFSGGQEFINRFDSFLSFKGDFRTAVILDSAIEVAVVSAFLRENTSFKICEQSGFRKDPMDKPFDILIGNKAVEVGIDFKGEYAIQRLVFSAFSVSEFLQRFGRLRNPNPEIEYKAICYAPGSVCDHFSEVGRISREDLKVSLIRTMKDPRVFENFRWRWGFFEAWEYLNQRATGISAQDVIANNQKRKFLPQTGGMSSDLSQEYLIQGYNLLYSHYLSEIGPSPESVQTLLPPLKKCDDQVLDVMEELSHFRGSGFSLLMFFEPSGEICRYDLFFLLRWAVMEVVEKGTFVRRIPSSKRKGMKDLERGVMGYVIVSGLRDRARRVKLEGPVLDQMYAQEGERLPGKVYGLLPVVSNSDTGSSPLNISLIAREMMKTGIFCRYLSMSAYHSRSYYELGDYASLVPFKEGCLALGYDALLADCAVSESSGQGRIIPML